jgi:hypothetical protein
MYGIVQASTYDNARNLPDDYIPSLLASYPPQLIDAYLNGRFVNLTSGSIYPDFDRRLNHSADAIKMGDALHIGMDFNVQNMTAIVNVVRDDAPISVAELTGVRDTPAMVKLIKERYAGHAIAIYPDASGQNTSSKNASESDLTIIKGAGLKVVVDRSNPAQKDRINSVNALILNAEGKRRWKVNTDACPVLTEALEQQAWDKNGEPDKSTGHDHPMDAVGYFLVKRWPIIKRAAKIEQLRI